MTAETKRPNGTLDHPEKFNKFFKLLEDKKNNEADEFLTSLESENAFESMWINYCRGLLFFSNESFDEGNDHFLECQTVFENIEEATNNETRLFSMALKKMGWYQRNLQNYGDAYKIHEEEFHLLEECGSSQELHDATISLDVDAYYLKDLEKSEFWLKKSLEYGESITDEIMRLKSLGMSTNNLSGTLSGLKKFKEAFEVIEKSLVLWKEFEEKSPKTQEYRVAWALFARADIYEQWALSTPEEAHAEHDKEKLLRLALESFKTGLDIGKSTEMPDKGQQFFNERIQKNKSLLDA